MLFCLTLAICKLVLPLNLLISSHIEAIDITTLCKDTSPSNPFAASREVFEVCPFSTTANFITPYEARISKVGYPSYGKWLLLGSCNITSLSDNCIWKIKNNGARYTLLTLYYDIYYRNKLVVADGHCKQSISGYTCEDGNFKMQSTTSSFYQLTWGEPFQMRIFYELYTKGCVYNITRLNGDSTIPAFRSHVFSDTFPEPVYCAWYIATFNYPFDIYLIFYKYTLYPYYGSHGICMSIYGSLWVTKLTKNNKAMISWKRCSKNSENLEIVKIDGKQTPWISVNFFSPDPSKFGFYAGGFYSESTCGGVITKGFDTINFYFKNGYGNHRFCTWIFTPIFSQDYYEAVTTYVIFHKFKLEIAYGCPDYVKILYYDINVKGFEQEDYFCEMPDRNPSMLKEQNIALQFKSDPDTDDSGFSATVIQTWSDCGKVVNVTEPMTILGKVRIRSATLCSWFFYGKQKFLLKFKSQWKNRHYCDDINLRIYDLSMDNYEQSRIDVCGNKEFHITSSKILVQLSGYGKRFNEVSLTFILNFTATISPSLSSSIQHATPLQHSSTVQLSTLGNVLQYSTAVHSSSMIQLKTISPTKSLLMSSSMKFNATITTEKQNKDVIRRMSFALLGGIISAILLAIILFVAFFIFYRRRQRQLPKKDSIIKIGNDKNRESENAVFYEHRTSKVALVNRDSNSLEAKSDLEPFVNIAKNSEKSVRKKAKTSFGKEIVELENEQDGKGLVNKSYEDSGDECELYESQEESPLSGIPRVSYSRGNPLYSLYGSPTLSHSSNLDDEGEDDIFLPKNQVIPVKKAPLTRSERESSNSLYGIYESNETTDIPSIPNVEEIKKKKKSLEESEDTAESNIYSDSENIYAPASVYAPSGFYASTSNPLYGRQSTAPENSLDINQYYAPHTTTNVSDDNEYYAPHEATTVGSKSAKLTNQRYSSSPEIIEEQNYACPDVSPPLSVNQITEEQEYSYATHPGVPNVEESNMLYGYQQPNVNMNNEEDRAVDDFSQDNALYG